jgi:hypothetical protein
MRRQVSYRSAALSNAPVTREVVSRRMGRAFSKLMVLAQ